MNPERLAEPQALAVVFTALVLVAALLVFTVGAGSTVPATDEAPITRERPDRLPSVAEGEAAASACEEAGHSKASVTLDVYSHVLLEEPAWLMERIAGDASVMPSQVLAAT